MGFTAGFHVPLIKESGSTYIMIISMNTDNAGMISSFGHNVGTHNCYHRKQHTNAHPPLYIICYTTLAWLLTY